jgi:DNA mismatch repair ATPase MutS
MHKDRDFDPDLLLIRRERELRGSRGYSKSGPDPKLDLRQVLPWNEAALRQDLGLNILLDAMSRGDDFLREVAQVALLSSLTNLPAIKYRQAVLADCLRNSQLIREIYQIAVDAIESERKNFWSVFGRYPAGTLHRAVDVLRMFVGMLKKLRAVADRHTHNFDSEGFSRLLSTLKEELSDDYFAEVEAHLRRLSFRHGTLISARLGSGNKGEHHVLRRPHEDKRNWLRRVLSDRPPAYTFHLHPRDEAGARALSTLNDRGINLVSNALAQSTDHILSFFQMLRTELAFYVGCLNVNSQLEKIGHSLCFPAPAHLGARTLSFTGLYDASLALSAGRRMVGNDLGADGQNLIIITGANTGGKSTFLRSVGLGLLMMQAGIFVPAAAFASEICEELVTHYKREEDTAMESGKWDEELNRMSEIVGEIKPNSAMLFNESFASTNEREGSEIASQIVSALLASDVKVFFVTHLYHFAQSFFTRRTDKTKFLRAERLPDGTRPFKLIEGEPLQTSYGEDLYRSIFSEAQEKPPDTSAKRI